VKLAFLAVEILAKKIGMHACAVWLVRLQFGKKQLDWFACLCSLARGENSMGVRQGGVCGMPSRTDEFACGG
jgi:hypothetical protein